jgi:[ribosomal protein S5]-alanine N-acetyltransferase
MIKLYTDNLVLEELNHDDAPFILQLVNTEGWLKFIGDKNIHTIQAAKSYLDTGPLNSYIQNDFGLMAVRDKTTGETLGMCGMLKRSYLDSLDLGFAFLPEHTNKGYAYKACVSILEDAQNRLNISKIYAITSIDNVFSIKLLKKLGFEHSDIITEPSTKELLQVFTLYLSK